MKMQDLIGDNSIATTDLGFRLGILMKKQPPFERDINTVVSCIGWVAPLAA